jgi:hypothetical protein
MNTQFSVDQIARAFGCTAAQVRAGCADTAAMLDGMARKANANGGQYRYATESHLRERAETFHAKSLPLWTVIGRGISPAGADVSLVLNNVPAASMPEAARKAVEHWKARGTKDYQPHKARKVTP